MKQDTLDQIVTVDFLDGVIVSASALEDPLIDGLLASSLTAVLLGHRRADETSSYVDIDTMALYG
jgi:DNA-binding LacI/PurR family transcriptional regulator